MLFVGADEHSLLLERHGPNDQRHVVPGPRYSHLSVYFSLLYFLYIYLSPNYIFYFISSNLSNDNTGTWATQSSSSKCATQGEIILHTSHFTLHTAHFTLHTSYFILHTSYFILHTSYFILHFVYFLMLFYILYLISYILYFIFYILYFIFYILYFIFYILYFIFYILYFIFYILYFTLLTQILGALVVFGGLQALCWVSILSFNLFYTVVIARKVLPLHLVTPFFLLSSLF